jgi:hypothetical protein
MAWKPLCWDYVLSQDGGISLVGWMDGCADASVSAIQRECSRELCSSAVFSFTPSCLMIRDAE